MVKKVLVINGVERTLVLEGTETLAEVLRTERLPVPVLPGFQRCGIMPELKPLRESEPWKIFIHCKQPGLLMDAHSADFVLRDLL